MFKLGITGSIATGKSTLLAACARLGVPVFSADAAVAALYAGEAAAEVAALFPSSLKNARIDRSELSRILAADPAGFARLEALIHPLVREKIADFFADARQAGHAVAAVEVPLLFESGHDYGFDAVAVTHLDPALQRRRILARPGMSVEKMEALLTRHLSQAEKKARGDYLFDTALPPETVAAELARLIAKIRRPGNAHDPGNRS